MSELKPCPFCGGKAELIDDRLSWYVSCGGCSATVIGERAEEPETEKQCDQIDWGYYEKSAIKAWNTRHIQEGYQLVPVDPSEGMRKAAWDTHYCNNDGALTLYRAMLKAAGDQDE